MAKVTLPDLVAGFNSAASINTILQAIEDALNNNILWRDNPVGESNEMLNDFDMNGNQILNLPVPVDPNDPVRLQDVEDALDSVFGVLPTVVARQVATPGQTDFTCGSTWLERAEIHWVRVDGVVQVPVLDYDIVADTPGLIRFSSAVPTNANVDVTSFMPNVAYYP